MFTIVDMGNTAKILEEKAEGFMSTSIFRLARSTFVVSLLAGSVATANAETDKKDTIKKTWAVDASHGTYSDAIPIEVPAFRGITPELALTYGSSDGNGELGVGWSLGGVGVIERASPGKGAPNYDAADIFLLQGQELVACTPGSLSPSCTTGGTHSTKVESYERIARSGSGADSRWTMTAKDGVKRVYAPVLSLGGADVFRWGLHEVIDTKGNVVTYDWGADQFGCCWEHLDSITYAGATITFHYEERSDLELAAIGDGDMRTAHGRIKTIDVTVGGSRVRAYKLSYTTSGATSRSLLASVQQFGTDAEVDGSGTVTSGTSLPAITIEYQASVPAFAEGADDLSLTNGADTQAFAMDINGDGKTDLLELYPSLAQMRRRTWISNGVGFDEASNESGMSNSTDARFLPMDVNGDGQTDIVEVYPNLLSWGMRTWVSNGSGFDEASNNGTATTHSDDSHFLAMDINGDGKSDLLELRPSFLSYQRVSWISTGTGFVEGANEPGISYNDDSRFFAMDINGDSKSDLLELRPGFVNWSRRIWLSHGNGFTEGATDAITSSSDDDYIPMDINGDGKTDLLQIHQVATVNYRKSWLSTGDSFTLASDEPGAPFSADNWYVAIDVNGDGRSDLIELENYGFGFYKRQIWLSESSRFVAGVSDTDVGYNSETKLMACDVDGDGLSEMIELYPAGLVKGRRVWWLAGQAYPDLLASLTNSLGGTTSVSYTPSSAWVNTNNPPLVQTVTAVTATDGRGGSATTDYEYAGGLHDRLEKRFLGYRYQIETLPCIEGESTCPYVETWFRQDYGAASKPERVDHRAGSGELLRLEVYEYTTNGATVPWTSQQTGEWEYTYIGPGAKCPGTECRRKYTGRTFDEYGEVTVEVDHGDYDLAGDEDTTSTTFVANTTDYIVSKPADVKKFAGIGTDGALLTETATYYDGAASWDKAPSAGLPTREARWLAGPSSFVETSKEYDTWGNLTAVVNALGARTEFAYEATYHLFPTSTTNALGQTTTTTWDAVCGAPTRTTDLNGEPTTMTHDALCRMSEKVEPGGKFERYTWVDLGTPGSQYELIERPAADGTDGPRWTRIYFDGKRRTRPGAKAADGGGTKNTLCEAPTRTNDDDGQPIAKSYDPQCGSNGEASGSDMIERSVAGGSTDPMGPRRDVDYQGRAWRTVTKGPDAATGDIHVDISYNARDRVAASTAPYYAGQAETYATTHEYDALDRPTRVTYPDGAFTTTSYGLWSVTRTDELGHAKTDRHDAEGRRVAHDEVVGNAVMTTAYLYDERGHLSRSTDPLGNVITYETDSLGRKVRMVDPDSGTWTYEYDGAGRLVAQTDGKGQRTELNYDALGRKTSKTSRAATDAAVTVSWTYDEIRDEYANVGHLTGMTDAAGDETFDHDVAGNVVKSVRTIDGERYAFEHGFDAEGRKLWTLYPDGGTLGTPGEPLKYDGAGRLRSIPGFVDAAKYDADGQLTRLENANGTETTRQYSPQRRWLNAISTTAQGTTIQDLVYTRNDKGLITRVTSSFAEEGWSYEYDELDRLIAATNSSNSEYDQTLEYDVIGNITYNSRLGDYSYGGTQPHAVTTAGPNTYRYDDGGMMTSGAGRTLTWDGDNQLASVAGGARDAEGPSARDDGAADGGNAIAGCGRVGDGGLPVFVGCVFVLLMLPRRRRQESMGPRLTMRPSPVAAWVAALALACGDTTGGGLEGGSSDDEDSAGPDDGPDGDDPDDAGDVKLTFTYDANGARLKQVDGEVTRRYFGDDYEIEVGGSSSRYILVGEVLVARTDGKVAQWVHVDHLGSIQAETDASGVESLRKKYEPYGEILASDGSFDDESRGYIGQRYDASGLLFLHARYYDPALGRFISPDTIISGPDTIGLNRYAYADNDPINKKDVNGHFAFLIPVVGVAALAEAALAAVAVTTVVVIGVVAVDAAIQRINKLQPHPDAEGPHTSFKRGPDGNISGYETYGPSDPRNPNPWTPEKRVDVTGGPHYNKKTGEDVPTPHVQGKDIPGGVRPADPTEVPRR